MKCPSASCLPPNNKLSSFFPSHARPDRWVYVYVLLAETTQLNDPHVTPDGKAIKFKPVPTNAEAPIVLSWLFASNSTDFSVEQSSNAEGIIVITVEGITTNPLLSGKMEQIALQNELHIANSIKSNANKLLNNMV